MAFLGIFLTCTLHGRVGHTLNFHGFALLLQQVSGALSEPTIAADVIGTMIQMLASARPPPPQQQQQTDMGSLPPLTVQQQELRQYQIMQANTTNSGSLSDFLLLQQQQPQQQQPGMLPPPFPPHQQLQRQQHLDMNAPTLFSGNGGGGMRPPGTPPEDVLSPAAAFHSHALLASHARTSMGSSSLNSGSTQHARTSMGSSSLNSGNTRMSFEMGSSSLNSGSTQPLFETAPPLSAGSSATSIAHAAYGGAGGGSGVHSPRLPPGATHFVPFAHFPGGGGFVGGSGGLSPVGISAAARPMSCTLPAPSRHAMNGCGFGGGGFQQQQQDALMSMAALDDDVVVAEGVAESLQHALIVLRTQVSVSACVLLMAFLFVQV